MRACIPVLVVLLLVLGPSSLGAQDLSLPPEVKAGPGFVLIEAKTDQPSVFFYSPDGLQFLPPSLLASKKTAVGVIVDANPRRYRVIAWVGPAGYAETVVVVGKPPPGPGPAPPGPPTPPVPPPPDSFEARLAAAYQADGSPKDKALLLAEFYRQMIKPPLPDPNIKDPGGPLYNPSLKTVADFFGVFSKAIAQVWPERQNSKLYLTVQGEFNKTIPTTGPLTDTIRQQIASQFERAATALETLTR